MRCALRLRTSPSSRGSPPASRGGDLRRLSSPLRRRCDHEGGPGRPSEHRLASRIRPASVGRADRADGRRGPDATRAHEASFLTSAKTAFGSGGTFGSSVTHLYRTTPPRSRTNTDRLATPSRPKLPKRSYWTP